MCNILSSDVYSDKWVYKQCCCGCTLRTGSLIIGWLNVLGCVIYLVTSIVLNFISNRNQSFLAILFILMHVIIPFANAVLLLDGIYKKNSKIVWAVFYIGILQMLFLFVITIFYFTFMYWAYGIVLLICLLILMLINNVLRSYAYEMDGLGPNKYNPSMELNQA